MYYTDLLEASNVQTLLTAPFDGALEAASHSRDELRVFVSVREG